MPADIDLEEVLGRYNAAWNGSRRRGHPCHAQWRFSFRKPHQWRKAVGKPGIGKIIESVFATLPDIAFRTRRLYVGEDFVVQEWTATATFSRPISHNGRAVPPTNRVIEWDGVDVIPFVDGLVARKDVYADSQSFQRQIGVGGRKNRAALPDARATRACLARSQA
jgi:hypothetical protein